MLWPIGMIGVRGDDGATTAVETLCQMPIHMAGDFASRPEYKDKVQVFEFSEFSTREKEESDSTCINLMDYVTKFREATWKSWMDLLIAIEKA